MKKFVKYPQSVTAGEAIDVDLREGVTLVVLDKLNEALSSIAAECANSIPEYDINYNDESGTNQPQIEQKMKALASEVALQLLYDCPFRNKFY